MQGVLEQVHDMAYKVLWRLVQGVKDAQGRGVGRAAVMAWLSAAAAANRVRLEGGERQALSNAWALAQGESSQTAWSLMTVHEYINQTHDKGRHQVPGCTPVLCS